MPMRIEPFTRLMYRNAVNSVPRIASSAQMPPVWKLSRNETMVTSVESLLTTTPAFCRPIKAMYTPMPTDTAFFSDIGITLNSASRTFVSERTMKIRPSTNTASSATCHG